MISELKQENGIWNLLVDGKPFTMLAGELHNSAASGSEYMEEMVWPYLRNLHLNSVLFPVYWECIEPKEGEFDFTLLDELLRQAEREGVKVGILWFGLWKNGISSYVPQWVKLDQERFFRAVDRNGRTMDVISPFCRSAVEADARAFTRLMAHIRETDRNNHTVIIVQVENEIGLLGSDRDYSGAAETVYRENIPEFLKELYQQNGNWEEAFGEQAPEYLMEYAYASALEKIASEGKKEYPLPMYANAWIEKFPWRPGGYPSGGPIARFLPLWRAAAPSVDLLAPDVYTSDFTQICREYTAEDNPLFIPEHRRDRKNLSDVFYALGAHNAICFAPFGLEDFLMPPEQRRGIGNPQVMKILNIDVAAWDCEESGQFLAQAYEVLEGALPLIRRYRPDGKIHSFIRRDEHERGTVISMGECDLRIDYIDKGADAPKTAGIVIETEGHEFFILGVSFRFQLLGKRNEKKNLGILEYSEGRFENAVFRRKRILNGDERYNMMIMEEPETQYVKWYRY